MIWWLDLLLFVVLIVTAVLALRTRDLLASVGLLAVLSLIAALLFTGMQALDVTFVEAALGVGVTGVLLIAAVLRTSRRAAPPQRTRRSNLLVIIPLLAVMAVLWVTTSGLPDRGQLDTPADAGAAPVYVERSLEDTQTPNVVTAILADYRSQDTLGETLVIVTAAAAVMLVLGRRDEEES